MEATELYVLARRRYASLRLQLLTAMVIGLAISLFQAVTTIHEQTLTFVPKALGVIALLVVLLPWMLRTIMEFTTAVIQKIPQMVQ